MDDRTQGALMLAVGAVAVRLGVTDAALTYIRPSYRPLLIVAGAVLVVLGGTALWRGLRPERPSAEAAITRPPHADGGWATGAAGPGPGPAAAGRPDDPDAHGHDHADGPRVAWLLTLPLFAILLIAPPPLGAFAANRQTGVVQSTATAYPPLPAAVDGAVPLALGEYTTRALYDTEESLAGQRVRLLGFVSEQRPDGFQLTRFQLACCAADGTAINVEVRGDPGAHPVDQWLEVEGTWQAREGHTLGELTADPPILVASAVAPREQPAEPYEY